jgi:outer membrane immunogenic protein
MSYRVLLASCAVAALSAAAPAFAQDQDETPWSGWYAGLNAGGAWGDASSHFTATSGTGAVVIPPTDITTINGFVGGGNSSNSGFTGGGEAGYNWRSGSLLLGLETDFDYFNFDQLRAGTFQSGRLIQPPITFTISQRVKTDWLWTIRPRIGYITGRWLLYATGGLSLSEVKLTTSYFDTENPPVAFSRTNQPTQVGWVAGGGVAYQFNRQWSTKVEYLYTDLGTVNDIATAANGFGSITSSGKAKANIVRLGVDYRF